MTSLLPTPEPDDPVEGQPGHFEHSNWLKASVKALDSGVVHKDGDTMTGNLTVPNATAGGHAVNKNQLDTLVQAGITVSDPNGLKRITFATPFPQTPAITLTADEYMNTPLFAQIRRSEPTHFEFSVEDKDGVYVAVNTHWVARQTTQ